MKGGGLRFLVINDSWCTGSKMTSHSCTPELETRVIRCCPFYLPSEFSSLILTAVSTPPEVSAAFAIQQLADIIIQHENTNPGALSIIVGDFNHTNLRKGLPKFCHSRYL